VLQFVAVSCSPFLQSVCASCLMVPCCSVLQCVAVCCSVLQSVLAECLRVLSDGAVLQCVAVCCSVSVCVAVYVLLRCFVSCRFPGGLVHGQYGIVAVCSDTLFLLWGGFG